MKNIRIFLCKGAKMDKIIYLILIVVILFSYKTMESFFKRFFPKLVNYQLWESIGYYFWGLLLLIAYLIARPNDYIIKSPINNKLGIQFILIFIISTMYICIKNPNVYYPRKDNKLRCFHYGVIQPIFEEVAFRGLILPMTIYLLGYNAIMIILLNGVIFMLFHLNYWSFEKEALFMFLKFLIIGLAFIYITIMTQSIIYSILCHIIVNGGNTLYRN
jgi:hypothetical protein